MAAEGIPAEKLSDDILRQAVTNANVELQGLTSALWIAVGYNQDPILAAEEAFPQPAQRRSDTEFSCAPQEEASLRSIAAELGPGRAGAENLRDLGIEMVDAEIVEPGQLHKTVTELRQALNSGQDSPLIVFASDREIPKWAKGKENEKVDVERLSMARLLNIGGRDLAGVQFFHRAGRFDERAQERSAELSEQALGLPSTEFEITERFLKTVADEELGYTLAFGFNPENGQLIAGQTGQVQKVGTVKGRDLILVHKEGGGLDTTATMVLMGGLIARIIGKDNVTASYYTSATYKPSRLMSGIKAGLSAAQLGRQYKVVVPTYGYEDLGAIKGDENPAAPAVEQIAGELGKTAKEARELRDLLNGLSSS